MKLYNTASRKIEEFIPLNPPSVTFYSCGPTVYDYTHIGHLRTYVNNDVLKKENFEWAVQKAVEVGVKEITPIITARTVKLGLNKDRLKKIIKEAAEQSGRGILPKLNEAIIFDEAIKSAKENDLNLFFNIGGKNVQHSMSNISKIGIFIGPEGGWDEEEIKKAQSSNGFTIVGLGKTILRAETAAVIASYQTVNLC